MTILSLPNELLIEVVSHLEKEQDIFHVTLVNRRLYHLFEMHLYRFNIRKSRCSALLWAAKHDHESTVRKMLHLGADVNVQHRERVRWEMSSQSGWTALHLAASKGHLALVKLLLMIGADPEARVEKRFTPLFYALFQRHDKVARTISRFTKSLPASLVDSEKRWTALHLSCFRALPHCTIFFLKAGAEIDAADAELMTPLFHSLT